MIDSDAILNWALIGTGAFIAAVGIFGQGYDRDQALADAARAHAGGHSFHQLERVRYITPLGWFMVIATILAVIVGGGKYQHDRKESEAKTQRITKEKDGLHEQLEALGEDSQNCLNILSASATVASAGVDQVRRELTSELRRTNGVLNGIVPANGATFKFLTDMHDQHVVPMHDRLDTFDKTLPTFAQLKQECTDPNELVAAIRAACPPCASCPACPACPPLPACNCGSAAGTAAIPADAMPTILPPTNTE
jgi:hypothetical protein